MAELEARSRQLETARDFVPWAQARIAIADVYRDARGDMSAPLTAQRFISLEDGEASYLVESLRVLTREQHPEPWARIQARLGSLYAGRAGLAVQSGDVERGGAEIARFNELSRQSYANALQVFSASVNVEAWCAASLNLARAIRRDNPQAAIDLLQPVERHVASAIRAVPRGGPPPFVRFSRCDLQTVAEELGDLHRQVSASQPLLSRNAEIQTYVTALATFPPPATIGATQLPQQTARKTMDEWYRLVMKLVDAYTRSPASSPAAAADVEAARTLLIQTAAGLRRPEHSDYWAHARVTLAHTYLPPIATPTRQNLDAAASILGSAFPPDLPAPSLVIGDEFGLSLSSDNALGALPPASPNALTMGELDELSRRAPRLQPVSGLMAIGSLVVWEAYAKFVSAQTLLDLARQSLAFGEAIPLPENVRRLRIVRSMSVRGLSPYTPSREEDQIYVGRRLLLSAAPKSRIVQRSRRR